MGDVRGPLMTSEEYRAWREGVPREATVEHIARTGVAPVMEQPGGTFTWMCPGCGGTFGGTFGPEPVSGWDAPRWTREGGPDSLTLRPSLGCPRWRRGDCIGHWWLTDGRLVLA